MIPLYAFKSQLLNPNVSLVKLTSLLFNNYPTCGSICSACQKEVDPLVGHILRCESNTKVTKYDMWVKIGDDVYISLASMDEVSLLDAFLGSFDTVHVPDVQRMMNKDSLCSIVEASYQPDHFLEEPY